MNQFEENGTNAHPGQWPEGHCPPIPRDDGTGGRVELALRNAATLLEALRLDNGVGQILGPPEREIYRAVEDLVKEALQDKERKEMPKENIEMYACPLLKGSLCLGPNCAWWLDGYGLEPGCAIRTLARHHVIASQFEPPVSREEIEDMLEGISESDE